MKLVELNWDPTRAQLRQFGFVCCVALPLAGWMWGASSLVLSLLVVLGFVLASLGAVFPPALKPIFLGLSLVAAPIGMIVAELVILLIYFGLFLPLGLCFRLLRRDALNLRSPGTAATTSHWTAKVQPTSVDSYYHQF